MSYQYFASIYDPLMRHSPYGKWLDFFRRQAEQFLPEYTDVLDLACGTGELTLRLKKSGCRVTGVDLSDSMLAIASQKAMEEGLHIPFFQQDMQDLNGLGPFDAVVSFCDSINYLESEAAVKNTFQSVYQVLKQKGLFLFDVHSIKKIEDFIGQTFADNGDDIAYIWNSFPGVFPHSVEHDLSFFVFDEKSGKYDRFDELHKQRTFPVEQYEQWLMETGFSVLSISGDFTLQGIDPDTERIFFTVRKD